MNLARSHVDDNVNHIEEGPSQDDRDFIVSSHVQFDEVSMDVFVLNLDQYIPCQSLRVPSCLIGHLQTNKCWEQRPPSRFSYVTLAMMLTIDPRS